MSSSASVWDCSLQSPWKRAQRAIVQGFVFPISVGFHWLLRTSCEVRQSMKVCRKSSSAGNNQLFHFIQEEEEMVWVPLLWFFSRNVLSFSSCSNSEQSLSQKIRISRRKPILRFFFRPMFNVSEFCSYGIGGFNGPLVEPLLFKNRFWIHW